MDLLAGEKRKNDEPRRRVPVWVLLIAAFALGVILTLMLRPSNSGSAVYVYGDESVWVTATYIIERATDMAGGVFFEESNAQAAGLVDPIYITATAIIQQATATAQAGP